MKRILLLGAGLVTKPLVDYLMKVPGFFITVASRTLSKAEALVSKHPRGEAKLLQDMEKNGMRILRELVPEHDIVISLLPYKYHVIIADLCIEHKKHLVTTSYVSKGMKERDTAAKKAGVILLNEIGVDPGIDHMSAMQVIDSVKSRGGKIIIFRSYCGGLPAPEANDNPFGYKFSWSPRGVVLAGTNTARYLEDGKEVFIPEGHLFKNFHTIKVKGLGELEAYPNRDSIRYRELYGLDGLNTIYRGTLRNKSWCRTWQKITELGLLSRDEIDLSGKTYREFLADLINADPEKNMKEQLADKLELDPDDPVIAKIEWAGLISDEKISWDKGAPIDILIDLLVKKLSYRPGERDMIVMQHVFGAEYPDGRRENIISTFIDYGIPYGDTAMARTVGLPAAIATRLILQDKITGSGVLIPVIPDYYRPILKELVEEHGVDFTKKVEEIKD